MATSFKRTCPECAAEFQTPDYRKQFCNVKCKTAHANRDTVNGKSMMILAQAWRAGRSTSDPALKRAAKVAFSEMCRYLDECNAEDRAAKRTPKLEQLARRHRSQGIHQL